MPIKETQARSASPGEKSYKLTDGGGLFLLVQPSGSKLWRMKYRFAGKEKLLSFGTYRAISLSAAREKRLNANSSSDFRTSASTRSERGSSPSTRDMVIAPIIIDQAVTANCSAPSP
jgi:Arm DNA-binding domain